MRRATVLLALLVLASSCGSSPPPRAEHASTGLVDVASVLPVRGAFNRDAGKRRLLVVLSPT
ncbi:MAG TPA: hypothetical protein VGJ77_21235 [Gaiellaceae bacterium]|jgi:hypothetical protein